MACFADINVSQGSVATYTQGVVGFKFPFDCEVTKESSSEEKKINRLKPLTALSGTVYRLASSMSDHTPVLFNVFEPLRTGMSNRHDTT